ncbi:MAG: glycosyltransferase, partial [Planctomycetota bacterium]|nr:glycosyltransferase [Planctomycetota bacterium]
MADRDMLASQTPPGSRRILYLSASSEIGGAEESLLTLLSALDRSAFQPFLALPGGGESSLGICATRMGIECVAAPLRPFQRTLNPLRLLLTWHRVRANQKAIDRIVRERKIDIIHANTAIAALQAAGAPLVCHLRDLRLPRLAASALRQRCRVFIAVSQAVSAFASQRLFRPVRCIPNGVDVERFRPAIGHPGTKRQYLLMAAHIAPWKRHDIFIECLAAIRSRDASIAGVIAGDDLFQRHQQHYERLRRLAADLGLHYALEWCGAVPREKMPALFSCATSLVHP